MKNLTIAGAATLALAGYGTMQKVASAAPAAPGTLETHDTQKKYKGILQMTATQSAVSNVTPIESDVFDTIPAAAQPSPGLACAAAHAYVELITDGRYGEIGTLFSSDAIFLSPDGNIYRGQEEITRFYSNFLGRVKPAIIPLSFVGEGNECIMELASRSNPEGKFRLSAIDHFTVDGLGKIARMVVYLRPAAIQELLATTKPNISSH